MEKYQKGFVNIILAVLIVVLVGALVYVTVINKPTATQQPQASDTQVVPPTGDTAQTPPPASQNRPGWKTYSGVGFEVQYPENTFAMVTLTSKILPPAYTTVYTGIKLVTPIAAAKLGKTECNYGQSGKTVVCAAEFEQGVTFFKVDSSASTLVSDLDQYAGKTNVMLAGKQTVKWSIGAEGEGADYYFYPLSQNTTLVIMRRYGTDGFPSLALFNQILATLVIK